VIARSSSRQRVLFALAAVVAAILTRLLVEAFLDRSVPLVWFLLASAIVAWCWGFAASLVTTVVSTVVLSVWFRISAAGGALDPRASPIRAAAFVAFSAIVGWIVSLVHEARRTLREASMRSAEHDRSIRDAALARAELAAIIESSDDAVVGKDLNGTVTSWNQSAQRVFGYSAAEMIGTPITRIIPDDCLAEEESVLAHVRRGEPVEHFDTVRFRKDGARIDVSIAVSPIKDSTGRIVGASKIARDISERRRADQLREELLAREQRALKDATSARDRLQFIAEVSALLTSSLDYEETVDRAVHLALPRLGDYCTVLVKDEHGKLRHVASGHVVREKEAIVRELAIRVIEHASVPSLAETVMKSGETRIVTSEMLAGMTETLTAGVTVESPMLELARQLRPFAYMGVPLRVRGAIVGAMSFATAEESRREYEAADATLVEEFARRVSLAVENARLFRHAAELNRLKDEFLATLSHELRTPLSAVLGWTKMLNDGQLDAENTARAIDAIRRNAEAQAKIVDDVLDVARSMVGNLRLDLKAVDLGSVIHRGVEAIAPAAAGKNIRMTVDAPALVRITGDADRLQQVMWNLLSNAVKFTPAGGRVTVTLASAGGEAIITVEDTGIGISREFLPFVFDKFRQADGSFTREHRGLGLGLAIARHVIELHGGSIEARSAGEGNGASFVFWLPRSA
jgi:PAS domain S-box-containing protein